MMKPPREGSPMNLNPNLLFLLGVGFPLAYALDGLFWALRQHIGGRHGK
jgi:hypothetical protein